MMKGLMVVGALVAVGLLVRRFLFMRGALTWERMLEQIPDTAPPKWMFSNIRAIRENTDRIPPTEAGLLPP